MLNNVFAQYMAGDSLLAQKYSQKAKIFLDEWQNDSAAFYYRKSADIYEKLEMWVKCAATYSDLLKSLNKSFRYDEAEPVSKKMINIVNSNVYSFNSPNSRKKLFTIYFNIGNVYNRSNELDSANYYYSLASKQITKRDYREIGLLYIGLRGMHKKKGNLIAMKAIKDSMLSLIPKITDKTVLWYMYYNIGKYYKSNYEYTIALMHYEKALYLINGKDSLKYAAFSLNAIGCTLLNLNEFHNAKNCFYNCLSYYNELYDKENYFHGMLYHNLALIYSYLGEYEKSINYYNKAIRIYKTFHPNMQILHIAGTYNNIAWVYLKQGNYEKSLELFKKSYKLRINILGEKHHEIANNLLNISEVYYQKKNYKKALEFIQRSIIANCEAYNDTNIVSSN